MYENFGIFSRKNDNLVEKKKVWIFFCVCVRPTTYSKNHIPFSFSFSNDWDGQCGRQLKPKYVSYAWFCPYNSIRCFSLHGARWSYFTRQVHKPPDLIFFKLEIIGIIVLCPGTRSMHIRPYAYCSPPYCTCSCEKCFFYKIRKKVLKKQPVQNIRFVVTQNLKAYSSGRYKNRKTIRSLNVFTPCLIKIYMSAG